MKDKRQRLKSLLADKQIKDRTHYSKKSAGIILSVISVVMVVLTVIGVILINLLSNEYENSNLLREWISKHPIISAAVMMLICATQVIIAFVPGEVVEVAAGYAFGAWWGALICMVGITIGSVIAILIARRFGRGLVEAFYPADKLDSMPILADHKKRDTFVFLLFLIPGTPKDLLTYIIGLTKMNIPRYVLLTFFARFPSIIMSTLSGDAMGEQKWMNALWFFIITAALSGIGYLVYLFIQKRASMDREKK